MISFFLESQSEIVFYPLPSLFGYGIGFFSSVTEYGFKLVTFSDFAEVLLYRLQCFLRDLHQLFLEVAVSVSCEISSDIVDAAS